MIAECPPFRAADDVNVEPGRARAIGSLLVFSDDWGRHPSSCQHLIQNLRDRFPVLWVNTIGTRAPRLNWETMKRAAEKIRQWGKPAEEKLPQPRWNSGERDARSPNPDFRVVNPRMWPWFGRDVDRRLNCWLLSKQLAPLLLDMPQPVVVVTTLPITADLPGVLTADRWIYYCVDDFSQWPGLDGETLRRMDREMIRRADSLIAVSETLRSMIAAEGRRSTLLTHGVDVEFWRVTEDKRAQATRPSIVFWGVIDRRMDTPTLIETSRRIPHASITLIGPQQDPDPAILSLPNVNVQPAMPLTSLPEMAAKADVLIMPYADLPVTQAMQPLKLKEYLATGRPVVVNRLPSTDAWMDCLDVAATSDEFAGLVVERLQTGVPMSQTIARERLQMESWRSKAESFEAILRS